MMTRKQCMNCKNKTYSKKEGDGCFYSLESYYFMRTKNCPFYHQGKENETRNRIRKEIEGEDIKTSLKVYFNEILNDKGE